MAGVELTLFRLLGDYSHHSAMIGAPGAFHPQGYKAFGTGAVSRPMRAQFAKISKFSIMLQSPISSGVSFKIL